MMNLIKQLVILFCLPIVTQGLFTKSILAQTTEYPELQAYKQLCFTDPLACQDIAKAAAMANKIVYEAAEMDRQLASCPWFYQSCDEASVQIIDNTITNQQMLRLLTDAVEPVNAENQIKLEINLDNLLDSFNRLGGYALVLKQPTFQANGRSKLSYFITFKGTNPAKINDLFTNAYVRETKLSEDRPDIRVHSGFRQYAQTVAIATEAKIQEMLAAQQDPNIDLEVLVTGHSLGGAAATIYGLMLSDRGILPENIQIITFGAPPFIKAESAPTIAREYGDLNLIAVENWGDLILDTALFQSGYELNSYVFPPNRQLVEGSEWRTLENLYKQRETILSSPDPTIFPEDSPSNAPQVAIESKIKIEQTRIHMDSYDRYYEYYLNVLKGDREFNQSLTGAIQQQLYSDSSETNPENLTSMATNVSPQYTLTNTIASNGRSIGIHPLAIAPDGQTLIGGSQDGSLTVWQIETGAKIAQLSAHAQAVTALAISRDGQTLASSSKNGNIKIWDLGNNLQQRHDISEDAYPINALAISPNGQYLVSGHGNGTINIWNLATGDKIRTISAHTQAVNSLVFSPNGRTIASGSGNEVVKLWQWETGSEIPNYRRYTGKVWAIVPGNEGELFVISSFDKTIKIWNLYSGEEIRSLSDNSGTIWTVSIPANYGETLANSDRPFFIYTGSWNGSIKVWSFSTGGAIFTETVDSRPVTDLVLTSDGQTLVSSSWDGKIRIWQK